MLSRMPEIAFGIYPEGGNQGTDGEIMMRWHSLGKELAPRLECFDDALSVLVSFADVLQRLAELDKNFTEEDFKSLLKELGFKDLTAYPKED